MPHDESLETSRLLAPHETGEGQSQRHKSSFGNVPIVAVSILPVAFLSALAMAATSATTMYAYAELTCIDPTHCRDIERTRYAGTVAAAVMIANIFALLTLGTIAKLSKQNHKIGLMIWIFCRLTSVAILACGGKARLFLLFC
jgi:hypothetical protein